MTDRDRLIELVCDKIQDGHCIGYCYHPPCSQCKDLADHILADGWIRPPCRVGDKLYIVANVSQEIVESIVIGIWLADGVFSLLSIHGTILTDNLGKTIFLTKEGAEKALAERKEKL